MAQQHFTRDPGPLYAGIPEALLAELDLLFPAEEVDPINRPESHDVIMFRAGQRKVVDTLRALRNRSIREAPRV